MKRKWKENKKTKVRHVILNSRIRNNRFQQINLIYAYIRKLQWFFDQPIRLFQRIKHHWKLYVPRYLRFPFDQISNIKLNLIIQRNRERYESALFEKSSSNKKESNSYSKYCGGTAFQRELYTFKLTILYISSLSVSALLILFPLFVSRPNRQTIP